MFDFSFRLLQLVSLQDFAMFSHNDNFSCYKMSYYLNVCLLNLVAYNKCVMFVFENFMERAWKILMM